MFVWLQYLNFSEQTMKNALVSNVNVELYNALHYHMSKKRLLTKDLKNGMTVPSMNLDLDLYINHYPNGVGTLTLIMAVIPL